MALVDDIRIMGSGMNRNVREALTKAEIGGSLTEVTQLDATLTDRRWALLSSGVLATGMRVEIGDFQLEIANISTGDDSGVENVTVKCRPIVVRKLKERRGPRVVRNVSPSQFVVSECQAVGANHVVQPSPGRTQVSRDVAKKGEQEVQQPPSSWTTCQRLGRELGFIVFEAAGTIYFGKPSWLITAGSLPTIAANYLTGNQDGNRTITVPQCTRSLDDPATTVDLSMIVTSASHIRAGKKLVLSGVPTFNGQYIISSFNLDLLQAANEVSISAATPLNPKAEPPR